MFLNIWIALVQWQKYIYPYVFYSRNLYKDFFTSMKYAFTTALLAELCQETSQVKD